jgi:hypothetical protein
MSSLNLQTPAPTIAPTRATRSPGDASTPRRTGRWLGALLIAEALLALAPMAILGPAIGWPASLDNPPAEQLAAIAAAPQAVAAGYGVYLLYSVLIAPALILLAARWFGGLQHPAAATVAAFAALSAMARSIGILRWLTVMPVLAAAHAGADSATRSDIERVFLAVNEYGGGIGELLGVGLFMAIALGTLVVAAWRRGVLPGWLAGLGAISALLLAGLMLPALGVPVDVPMAAAVSVLSLWMLAAGVWVLRQR